MAARKKTVLKHVSYWNIDSFAAYLSGMARKGWHFKEWGLGLTFEQGEPRQDRYCVEVFDKADENALRPEPQTEEFAEYCQAAGWELVDARGKYCIFRQIKPDAVPILTDRERLSSVCRAMAMRVWVDMGLGTLWMWSRWEDMSRRFSARIFADGAWIYNLFWGLLFVAALIHFIHFYLWKFRTAKKLRAGQTIRFAKKLPDRAIPIISMGGLALLILWYRSTAMYGYMWQLLFAIGALILLWTLLSIFRPDSTTTQIVAIGSCFGIAFLAVVFFGVNISDGSQPQFSVAPPLTRQDFLEVTEEPESVSHYAEENFLGSLESWNLQYEENRDLYFDIYRSDEEWVLDKIWEEQFIYPKNSFQDPCTEDWGAVYAFRNGNDGYLVRWEDTILVFNVYERLSTEQIRIIRDALELR